MFTSRKHLTAISLGLTGTRQEPSPVRIAILTIRAYGVGFRTVSGR